MTTLDTLKTVGTKTKNVLKALIGPTWKAIVFLLGIVVVAVGYAKRKQTENQTLQTQNNLNQADKQSAVLDAKIEDKQSDNKVLDSNIAKVDTQISKLDQQEADNKKKQADLPADQVEKYWQNN